MTSVASTSVTDQVEARLQTLSGVAYYRTEVGTGTAAPPTYTDSDRVAPYLVLYPFPGKPAAERGLAITTGDIDWGGQITCAAGFAHDCEHLVDRVVDLLFGWSPTIANTNVGVLLPPTGFDPGPVRIDRSIIPPRFSLALQYRLGATAI